MKWRERTIDFDSFVHRHIGPNQQEIDAMLAKVGFEDLDALIDAAIPKNIRLDRRLDLPEAKSEGEALAELSALAKENKVARSFIGAGYSDCNAGMLCGSSRNRSNTPRMFVIVSEAFNVVMTMFKVSPGKRSTWYREAVVPGLKRSGRTPLFLASSWMQPLDDVRIPRTITAMIMAAAGA